MRFYIDIRVRVHAHGYNTTLSKLINALRVFRADNRITVEDVLLPSLAVPALPFQLYNYTSVRVGRITRAALWRSRMAESSVAPKRWESGREKERKRKYIRTRRGYVGELCDRVRSQARLLTDHDATRRCDGPNVRKIPHRTRDQMLARAILVKEEELYEFRWAIFVRGEFSGATIVKSEIPVTRCYMQTARTRWQLCAL